MHLDLYLNDGNAFRASELGLDRVNVEKLRRLEVEDGKEACSFGMLPSNHYHQSLLSSLILLLSTNYFRSGT